VDSTDVSGSRSHGGLDFVMAGLVPANTSECNRDVTKTWMPGTRPHKAGH